MDRLSCYFTVAARIRRNVYCAEGITELNGNTQFSEGNDAVHVDNGCHKASFYIIYLHSHVDVLFTVK